MTGGTWRTVDGWRAVCLGTHWVVCRWGRIWGVLDAIAPTRAQLAEAYGRAMWSRRTDRGVMQ